MAEQKQQVPSIGRVVHYILPEGDNAGVHRPALIVEVQPDTAPRCVDMVVFLQPGDKDLISLAIHAQAKEGTDPGTWHWPEYVAAV